MRMYGTYLAKRADYARKTGIISIKYDTSRLGAINKTVTITTNEVESKDANGNPIYKNHVIQVKGNVKQP
jgi:hypothetical protein